MNYVGGTLMKKFFTFLLVGALTTTTVIEPLSRKEAAGQLEKARKMVSDKGNLYLKCLKRNCSKEELATAQKDLVQALKVSLGVVVTTVAVGYGAKWLWGKRKAAQSQSQQTHSQDEEEDDGEEREAGAVSLIDATTIDSRNLAKQIRNGTIDPNCWVKESSSRVPEPLIYYVIDQDNMAALHALLVKNVKVTSSAYFAHIKPGEEYYFSALIAALYHGNNLMTHLLIQRRGQDFVNSYDFELLAGRDNGNPIMLAMNPGSKIHDTIRKQVLTLFKAQLPEMIEYLKRTKTAGITPYKATLIKLGFGDFVKD